jgi:putative ABC transport system substrate-binding protein
VRRRAFITLIGGAASWPLAARAQGDQTRHIGVLMNLAQEDAEGQARIRGFVEGLQQLGWSDGRNARIDARWGAGDAARIRRYAAELVALNPDVILASASPVVGALQQVTHTVPIVFANVIDPVAQGFVSSLARPGGNTTGFMFIEYAVGGKWLQLLKEIAPYTKRAAVIRDLSIAGGSGQLGAVAALAPLLDLELTPIDVRDSGEIERGIAAFGSNGGGLVVLASTLAAVHRELIINLASQYRLPGVYFARFFVMDGGLISYGPNNVDQYRRAATYVDRILKGEKPGDLPVQAPTKYELVINLKTAKALGLNVPSTLLARADEVVE